MARVMPARPPGDAVAAYKAVLKRIIDTRPSGTRHRLENPGKIDLELIEVQTGSYLDEDDIVRLQDVYNRG